VGLIAAREFTEFWRDGRLLLAGGLMLVLLLTALAVGWQQQHTTEDERSAAQALGHEHWLQQDQRHPHDAAHQGLHAFKPLPPAAIIDPGITPSSARRSGCRRIGKASCAFARRKTPPACNASATCRWPGCCKCWGHCSSSCSDSTPLPASANKARCARR
jgi:hypothetical protein